MKFSRTFFTTLMILGFNFVAQAAPQFTYRVETVIGATPCADRAKQIGDQFSAFGAPVTDAVCKSTRVVAEDNAKSTLGTIIITYSAQRPVSPYLAVYGGSEFQGEPSTGGAGLVSTLSECVALANEQTANFEAETKLKVLAVECSASEYSGGYSVQLSALGKPARRLYMYDQNTQAGTAYYRPELTAAAANVVKTLGGTVVLEMTGHVFYYFTRTVPISNHDFGQFDSVNQCKLQQADALTILEKGHMVAPQTFCNNEEGMTPFLDGIGGDIMTLNSDFGYRSVNYASFEECFADRDRLIQNGKSSHHDIYGVICRRKIGNNQIFVAETYTSGY